MFPLSVLIIPTTGVLASQQICSLVAWHSSITRQYIRIRHCKWEFSVVGVSSCQMCPLSTLPNTAVNYTQHSCELYSTRLWTTLNTAVNYTQHDCELYSKRLGTLLNMAVNSTQHGCDGCEIYSTRLSTLPNTALNSTQHGLTIAHHDSSRLVAIIWQC